MRTRIMFSVWGALLGLLSQSVALAGPVNTFNVSGGSGMSGESRTSIVTFDTVDLGDGWSFGVCHDGADLLQTGVALGSASNALKGGTGPEFVDLQTMPMPGPGVTYGAIIDFQGVEKLPIGAGQEILLIDFDLIGVPMGSDIVSDVFFCDTLGSPGVDLTYVVNGGTALLPATNDATYTIIDPGPPPAIDLTCEGGVSDATLTWTHGGFDYFLVHRDGVLIETIFPDPMSTMETYIDPALPPGTYTYFVIGVVFPMPDATPIVELAGCTIDIVPVTIDVMDGISPIVGPFFGGTMVTITGTGFTAAMDTSVFFDGVEQAAVIVVDDNTITLQTQPVTMLGSVDVTVMNSEGSATVPDGFTYGFNRGEANDDGQYDFVDAVFIAEYLFVLGSPAPACFDAADVNDDGLVNIADPIYSLTFLFSFGPEPPPPFTEPGIDPTPDYSTA